MGIPRGSMKQGCSLGKRKVLVQVRCGREPFYKKLILYV